MIERSSYVNPLWNPVADAPSANAPIARNGRHDGPSGVPLAPLAPDPDSGSCVASLTRERTHEGGRRSEKAAAPPAYARMLNLKMCQIAATPSRHPIFLPSAYVRPE